MSHEILHWRYGILAVMLLRVCHQRADVELIL